MSEITGKIKVLGETKSYGSNGFQKRELVVETDEQYPQPILVEFVQDKTDLLDSLKLGDSVKVGINLRGREWQSPQGEIKYFNSITGWRIEKVSGESSLAPEVPPFDEYDPITNSSDEEDDDLPF